jgi:hypothetical protein
MLSILDLHTVQNKLYSKKKSFFLKKKEKEKEKVG